MNGILLKWLIVVLLIPVLILLFYNRIEGLQGRLDDCLCVEAVSSAEHAGSGLSVRKAEIFHNRAGLKNDIEVIGPLRELNAVAKSTGQSIEELIEEITIWIPRLYYEQFLIQPGCIIILETKINEYGKAEVRFGVAMKCAPKNKLAAPVII